MNKIVPPVSIALGLLVFTMLAISAANFDPEIDGFGRNWKSFAEATFDRREVLRDPQAIARTGVAWQSAGYRVVLWLGASQLHTISAVEETDRISVVRANELAEQNGTRVRFVQLSYGNATMHELLGAYLMAREEGFVPDGVILAFVYDDLRERGVRGGIAPRIDDELRRTGGSGVAELEAEIAKTNKNAAATPVQRNAVEGTPQQAIERSLTEWLEGDWYGYANRGRLKGMLEIGWKQLVSRAVLGKERRRSIIVDREQEAYGLSALDALRRIALADGSRMFLYVVPLLHRADYSYYQLSDYQRFTGQLAAYCHESGVDYQQFDQVVPADLFGLTNSGLPDYFHFNGTGHSLVASKVESWVAAAIRQ